MVARCLNGCDREPAAWRTSSPAAVHTFRSRWNDCMGQKINPVSFRTGIMIGWKSRWYASKKEYASLLMEDHKIRKYVTEKYKFAGIPKIEIERTRDEVKVVLHAARPGVIIGRKGQQVDQLQDELQNLVGRRINIKIEEITRPELQAHLVAEEIAEQLSKRASFRRTMKRVLEQTLEAGAKGIKVQLAGEFGLQAMEGGWVSAQTIEAGRIAATQYIRGEGRLYVRVFPHKSITSIPLETRMGKGKGEPEFWAAVIRPGTVLYELGGVTEAAAKMCHARLAHKMPIRVRMVKRQG